MKHVSENMNRDFADLQSQFEALVDERLGACRTSFAKDLSIATAAAEKAANLATETSSWLNTHVQNVGDAPSCSTQQVEELLHQRLDLVRAEWEAALDER